MTKKENLLGLDAGTERDLHPKNFGDFQIGQLIEWNPNVKNEFVNRPEAFPYALNLPFRIMSFKVLPEAEKHYKNDGYYGATATVVIKTSKGETVELSLDYLKAISQDTK